MSLLKSITLLLVAALANPMCCCLVAGEMDAASAPAKSLSDAHACCHSTDQGTASNHEESASHSDQDCYHEDLKLTQINDVSVHSQTLVANLDALFAGYLTIGETGDDSVLRSFAKTEYRPFDSHFPPGSRISRSLCVYLI
jgi:hypothetical protein